MGDQLLNIIIILLNGAEPFILC